MSIFVALHHVTHYKYDRPIDLGPQTIRLRPAPHTRTPILSYSLKVTPSNHFVNWQQDPQGNWLARFVFPEKATELKIEVDFTAQMTVINPFDFFVEPYADSFPFAYTDDLKTELAPYLATIEPGPLFAAYLAGIPREAPSTVNFLVDLNAQLQKKIRYIIRMEPGIQTPEETLASGAGSCRDSAWLLIQILRHLGLAARFVSGYLIQLRPDIDPVEGPREVENDFTDLHAWAEVYLPGAGWIGFDVTSGMLTGEGHIPVAATPHYRTAAPICGRGRICQCRIRLRDERQADPRSAAHHKAVLRRILGAPRQARRAGRCRSEGRRRAPDDGRRADLRLRRRSGIAGMEYRRGRPDQARPCRRSHPQAADAVRAGRPAALRAGQMVSRRKPAALGVRPVLAQGRRADLEEFRSDRDDRGAAQGADRRRRALRGRHGGETRRRCRISSCRRSKIPAHWLQKEAGLPPNVDPSDSKLSDPEERARMARVFDQGLNVPRGFVLPIQRWNADASKSSSRWKSERWKLRRGNLFLTPGDSPLGLRLPIASLPHIPADEYPYIVEQDPLEPREALPVYDARRRPRRAPHQEVQEQQLRGGGVRTAMSIEIRDGVLCAFMPPVEKLEDYLELVTAVEATAEEMQMQVHVEGYPPPFDPRVEVIKVTPDPGVIEVNIQPATELARGRRHHLRPVRRRSASRGSAPTASWSTAATPAPAAAITSWSAAARRRIRRSCAVRIC